MGAFCCMRCSAKVARCHDNASSSTRQTLSQLSKIFVTTSLFPFPVLTNSSFSQQHRRTGSAGFRSCCQPVSYRVDAHSSSLLYAALLSRLAPHRDALARLQSLSDGHAQHPAPLSLSSRYIRRTFIAQVANARI